MSGNSAWTASTTTGSTASWAVPSPRRCRAPCSTEPTRARLRSAVSAFPNSREGGDEQRNEDETRVGAARHSVPEVRLRPLRGDLHPTDSVWSDPQAARVSALREAGDDDGGHWSPMTRWSTTTVASLSQVPACQAKGMLLQAARCRVPLSRLLRAAPHHPRSTESGQQRFRHCPPYGPLEAIRR